MKGESTYIHALLVILLVTTGMVRGQYFENPSFEGEPGIGNTPPGWFPADEHSTPDTEPVDCDHFAATDGSTFMTLVTRGTGHPEAFGRESAGVTLLETLSPGHYYELSVDLASRDDLGHFTWEEGFVAYTAQVSLKIYQGLDQFRKGALLGSSGPVTNPAWDRFSFILFPGSPVESLILEVFPMSEDDVSGNLVLDRIHLEQIDQPPLDFGELEVPNVFTPNGDGFNDVWMIRGLPAGSSLTVFDRSGRQVFFSNNYEHNWNGNDSENQTLPEDTYWFVLFPADRTDPVKGFVYLKRE